MQSLVASPGITKYNGDDIEGKERRSHQPLEVERVNSFEYLGVHFREGLTKHQRLYFLRTQSCNHFDFASAPCNNHVLLLHIMYIRHLTITSYFSVFCFYSILHSLFLYSTLCSLFLLTTLITSIFVSSFIYLSTGDTTKEFHWFPCCI